MHHAKLFRRDFTLMVAGQVISLLGNAVLSFALPLYVLDETGNAAAFGGVLALSTAATALLSPVGGLLADRFPRQRIMYLLDFFTASVLSLTALVLARGGGTGPAAGLLLALSAIEACYQPSVTASVPLLVEANQLAAANGVVAQVQALSNLLGPILGGFLYAAFGLLPLLWVGAGCFAASAVLELFLRIPFVRRTVRGGALAQARADLGEALRFLLRDRPALFRLLLVTAGLNLSLSALYTVGLPVLVKNCLGLGDGLYGLAQGALGVGAVLGGLAAAGAASRLPLRRSHLPLLAAAALLLPVALALVLPLPPLAAYGVLLAALLLGMAGATVFSVLAQTCFQRLTPPALLGKVASFVTAIAVCAMPLGQGFYGVLFEVLARHGWAVVLLGGAASLLLALACGRVLPGLEGRPDGAPESESSPGPC